LASKEGGGLTKEKFFLENFSKKLLLATIWLAGTVATLQRMPLNQKKEREGERGGREGGERRDERKK
jgi:hypothetical protein